MTEKKEFREIFSEKVSAGRRTYFFDVRSTKAGDYYMTIAESIKDFNDQGKPSYRKHKIQLYKEDFKDFKEAFESLYNFIIAEKGEKIICNKRLKKEEEKPFNAKEESPTEFTEVNFEDLGKD